MKKRKLTKEQIEKRKHFLKVTKNVVFYISLALNAIVLIALCFSGCSSNKANVRQADDHIALFDKPQIDKNEKINDFDIYNNSSTICYDLTTLNVRTNAYITTGDYHYFSTIDNIILFGGDGVVWSDVNEIYVAFNVYQGGVDGSSILIRATHRNADTSSYTVAGRYWGYSNGSWQTQDLPNNSGYSTYNGFYIAFNYAQLNENQFGLIGLLENLFNTIDYKDFDLSQNWSPYAFIGVDENFIYNGALDDQYVLKDTIFAIGGRLYNQLVIDMTQTTLALEVQTPTGVVQYPSRDNNMWSFIVNVHAENTTNGDWLLLYSLPRGVEGSGGGLRISPYNLLIKNYTNLRIRLFGINLQKGVANGYTNGNALSVEYIYSNSSLDGNTANLFSLFSSAFSGIASILAIQVLPGFTLGILLFVPLVAIIVFALIRIIKK